MSDTGLVGPATVCREELNSAATSVGTIAQYKPYSGGSPASVANATPCGRTTIAPIRPASASALSVPASTRGHHFMNGISRCARGVIEAVEGVTSKRTSKWLWYQTRPPRSSRGILSRFSNFKVPMPVFRKPAPAVMLVCSSVILTLALGTRHSFGLFLQPMSMDNGWGREVFGFAVALQNLLWGLTQPLTGMLADRFGARRVLFAGGLLYVLGLVFMANSTTALGLTLAIGIFVGIGMSCTTFNIVFGALGRAYPAEKRSVVLGISSAAGSLDRKSTRLNSSHPSISYAVFCLKKKKKKIYSVVQASRSIS